MKPVLTTGDVAKYCHVSLPTVFRWIKNGHLSAYTLPNGHHRILPSEFRVFLERHGMPMRDGLLSGGQSRRRILIVDSERQAGKTIARVLTQDRQRFDVARTNDVFEAGMLLSASRPHLVILDLDISGISGFEVLQRIRANPETAEIKILVLTGLVEGELTQRILASGADAVMGEPLDSAELLTEVEQLLAVELELDTGGWTRTRDGEVRDGGTNGW